MKAGLSRHQGTVQTAATATERRQTTLKLRKGQQGGVSVEVGQARTGAENEALMTALRSE